MTSKADMPALVGTVDVLEGAPRELWLSRTRNCRRRLIEIMRKLRGALVPAVAEVDQALELTLMCRFIRDRKPAALPLPEIDPAGMTTHDVCHALRQAANASLLKSVFDPVDFGSRVLLPHSLWRAILSADVGWCDRAGRFVRLPATALGEFHQLCLAERDTGRARQRRAQGIHYTPVALADYLTLRVLDRLFVSREFQPPVRILDPSCGGGTFLLAALRYLMNRKDNPSPQETLDLLAESLFGTDIDPEAVATTRRSLLLAAWDALVALDIRDDDRELIVPDLRNNFVCQDFLASCDSPGQFQAILGGPPFVRTHEMLRNDPGCVERYRAKYRTARSGQFDLFMPFFEEAVGQLAERGWLGWSVASTFLRTSAGRILRSLIGQSCSVHELIEFEDSKVYPDAVTQIVLVLLEKERREVASRHVWITGTGAIRGKLASLWSGGDDHPNVIVRELPASAWRSSEWSFATAAEQLMLERIRSAGSALDHLPVSICQGLVTGADPLFLFPRCGSTTEGETLVQCRNEGREFFLETAMLRPVVRSREIKGYGRPYSRTVCLTPYDRAGQLVAESVLRDRYPLAYKYLLTHREALTARRGIRPREWYALRSTSCLALASGPRVFLKLICSGSDFTIDTEEQYLGHAGTLMLVADGRQIDPFYLLAVLNSKVFWFFVRQTMPTMGHGRHVLRRGTLRRFPLVVSSSSCDAREQIAGLARSLLEGLPQSERPRVRTDVERRVTELYEIDSDELSARKPGDHRSSCASRSRTNTAGLEPIILRRPAHPGHGKRPLLHPPKNDPHPLVRLLCRVASRPRVEDDAELDTAHRSGRREPRIARIISEVL
jgi:hypothetical protein